MPETFVKAEDENGDEFYIPFPVSEHAKRQTRAQEAIEELTRAYNQKDDVLFEVAVKEIRGLLFG